MSLVRSHAVVTEEHLAIFLQGEEFLFPESFSVLHSGFVDGLHIRPMTIADHLRVGKGLKEEARAAAEVQYLPGYRHGELNPEQAASAANLLDESVLDHLRGAAVAPTEAFVRIDLRLPPSVISQQLQQVVDQLRKRAAPFLIQEESARNKKKEKTAFHGKSWFRSRVLPYLDLCHWLEELPLRDRPAITAADLAFFLDVDTNQLTRTTKAHAAKLSDHLTWEFMQLAEAVINSSRSPLTPIRTPKRRRRNTK
jgi:hypothetical protein